MHFVWFQPPLGSAGRPLRLSLALISARGEKSAYSVYPQGDSGWAGERITPRPGCSAEQVVATAGREIQRGCRVALEPDERLNQLSIREKICLKGSLPGAGRGGDGVVVSVLPR